ncbi:MAG: D-alanyl-D-alanine carboxypeptidase/D-alanyl-D-alanine-endopeptidase [Prevotellaceae bacterium]|jgi:D-alanyl-D-alanine carboxypeptidase/D-alanyl-D-alanine-endopeptidase (penicillin-binding protein 4)|nr:D-alanyl-D-alanine carboxypeptidase/D-alanyl-D-alanine-endopeptidase [Prevotellaceae bacterium]
MKSLIRRTWWFGWWLLCPAAVFAQTPEKSNAVAAYVELLSNEEAFRHVSMSLLAIDAATQQVIASYRPQTALLPASTLKLVTTGLSLLSLGSDYRYRTSLYYDGTVIDSTLAGNLYIIGGGDPTFGSADSIATPIDEVFSYWVAALKANGIHRVAGDIVADETFLGAAETPESWMWGDIGNYYGAQPSGLPFCENAYSIVLTPGQKEGDKTTLRSCYPFIPGAEFINEVTTGAPGSGNQATIYNSPFSELQRLAGAIPVNRDSTEVKGSNNAPAYTCIYYFGELLNRQGIHFDGALRVVSTPEISFTPRTLVAYHLSPPMKEIASATNKISNNFFAETLLKTIGLQRKQNASYDSSLRAVRYLLDSLQVPASGFKMADGSGLSRRNYVSAQFMVDYLTMMYHSEAVEDFFYTLATPGDRGTFSTLLRSSPNKRRLHAKSGSMGGVRCYAGYAENPQATIIFAILVNNFNYKISDIQPKIEKFLELITEW